MLHSLYVKNLALIDELEVEFHKGLNILTGETGAGKSIILGSIHLALGGRYSADMLRSGAEYGYVELTFLLENESQIEQLKERDIYPEDGMVTLSRRLMEKRSVSKINGETVSIGSVKEIAHILIDIHGQHEHQSLLYKKQHLAILDEFAKEVLEEKKKEVSNQFSIYKKYQHEYENAILDEKERKKEMDFLRFEIEEIKGANLQETEDEVLEEQYRKMIHGKKITEILQEVSELTSGMSHVGASELLSRSVRCMQEISGYDEQAEILYRQLGEIDDLLNDFNREMAQYKDGFEFSEQEFYETENRLNEINRLKSKYGNTVEEILCYKKEQEETLQKLEDYDTYLENLKQNLYMTETKLNHSCQELSQLRKEKAVELTCAIREGLLELNFLDVQFEMKFYQMEQPTANGFDEAEFMISMNPGEPVRALSDVASGGELSRIMLAIKTVLAKKDQVETLIFDEIDVGISGRTAQKVSEKMAVIGKNHQVICITHLAQIAAMADYHYVIEKNVMDGHTRTGIALLNHDDEIQELARILGGAEITETVIQSAKEMKALAKGTK